MTVGYHWRKASVSGNCNYYVDWFSNYANTIELEAFDVVTFRWRGGGDATQG